MRTLARWPNHVNLRVFSSVRDHFVCDCRSDFFAVYPNKWYQSKLEIARCRCDRWNAEIIIAPAGSWREIQPRIQILAAIAEIVEFTKERSSLPFVAEGELMEFSTDRLLLVVKNKEEKQRVFVARDQRRSRSCKRSEWEGSRYCLRIAREDQSHHCN